MDASSRRRETPLLTLPLPTDGTLQELELRFAAEADGSALEITNLVLIENEL